jgi:hypothetical protein
MIRTYFQTHSSSRETSDILVIVVLLLRIDELQTESFKFTTGVASSVTNDDGMDKCGRLREVVYMNEPD